MKKTLPVARRQFLRGLSGFTLGLPFLPSLLPGRAWAQANTFIGPRRFVAMTSGHGGVLRSATYPAMPANPMTQTIIGDYQVRSTPLVRQLSGTDAYFSDIYRAPASELTARLVGKMNLLRAISVPWYIAHNSGGMLGNFARNDANGSDGAAAQAFPTPTIDQIMAYSPNFYRSLTGVVRRSVALGNDGGLSFGFANPTTRTGAIVESARLNSPRAAFDALYRAQTPSPAPPAPPAPRRAVVDLVLGEYNHLRQSNRRLSRDDRERLDAHIARLDDLQRRVGSMGGGAAGGGSAGGGSSGGGMAGGGSAGGGSAGGGRAGGAAGGGGAGGGAAGGGAAGGGAGGGSPGGTGIAQCQNINPARPNTAVTGAAHAAVQHLYNDVIAMSFACGATRIAVMPTDEYRYEVDTITGDWHQDVAHAWNTPGPQVHLQNAARQAFQHNFLDLARKLDAVDDAPGVSVLDNTLMIWMWESGEETHANNEVPVLMAGGAGGFLRTGQYCDYRDLSPGGDLHRYNSVLSERPGLSQNQFLATCLQAMGVSASEFNNLPNGGFKLMTNPPPQTGYGFAQITSPYQGSNANSGMRGSANSTRTLDTMTNMNALLPFLRA